MFVSIHLWSFRCSHQQITTSKKNILHHVCLGTVVHMGVSILPNTHTHTHTKTPSLSLSHMHSLIRMHAQTHGHTHSHTHTPDTQTKPEGHKADLVIAQLWSTFHHLWADIEGSAHLSCQVSVPAAGPRGAQGVQVRWRSHAAVSQASLLLPANCHPPHFTTMAHGPVHFSTKQHLQHIHYNAGTGTWSSALCHKTASPAHSLQGWHWHMVQCTLPQNSISSTCKSWLNIARSILLLGSFMNTESLWVHLQTVHQICKRFHLARMMERMIQNTPMLFWNNKCGLGLHSFFEWAYYLLWNSGSTNLALNTLLYSKTENKTLPGSGFWPVLQCRKKEKLHVQSVAAQIKRTPCQRGL